MSKKSHTSVATTKNQSTPSFNTGNPISVFNNNIQQYPTERSSLLPKSATSSYGTTDQDDDHYEDYPEKPSNTSLQEFWLLLRMSIPVILAYTLQNSLQTASVLIVGRLSPQDLAAAAFSYMFAMCTAWLLALGGTTALDTLCSTSFTSSRDPHELGILLQRAFLVLGGMYAPVCMLWWFSEPLFLWLGQEPQIARDSSLFLKCLIPGGLGYIYFEATKKFLQAQGIVGGGTTVLLVTSPLSALLNWVAVYKLNLGLIGAPLATGVAYWLSFIGLVVYGYFAGGLASWGGFDKRALSGLSTFARLAGLGVVMVGTEWWAFEIVALAAGRLGTVSLAAQSVIMTTDQVLNTIPFGIGIAASTRVGNLLGARDPKGAQRAANAAAYLSIVTGTVVLIGMMVVRDTFALIFNKDPEVVRLTAQVIPYVALFQIADGLNGSCGGSLRGMGRQHTGAIVNIVSYYFGALPLGIHLAFNGWGLQGLWVGQCIALYVVGSMEWALVIFSDWKLQVKKAFERLDDGDQMESGGF
ncbi:MATE family multidrug resistance protein [Pyronema omphalodes]|nr:MATE family multidrug resistance protein [Pyronema omphalodes]